MEESEFEKNMQLAKLANEETAARHGSILQLSGDDALTTRRHGKEIHVNLEGNFTVLYFYLLSMFLTFVDIKRCILTKFRVILQTVCPIN